MEKNSNENILSQWVVWQFFEMPKVLLNVWNNYLIFATNIFSLPLLLKTFFSPWRRYKWRYPKGFALGEFFSTLVSNIFSRFMGALMRIFLIIAGILFQIFVLIGGAVVFIAWFLAPFIIITGLIFAIFL